MPPILLGDLPDGAGSPWLPDQTDPPVTPGGGGG